MSKPNPLYLNGVQPPFLGHKPSINWKAPTLGQAAFANTFLGEVTQQQKSHVVGRTSKGPVLNIKKNSVL